MFKKKRPPTKDRGEKQHVRGPGELFKFQNYVRYTTGMPSLHRQSDVSKKSVFI